MPRCLSAYITFKQKGDEEGRPLTGTHTYKVIGDMRGEYLGERAEWTSSEPGAAPRRSLVKASPGVAIDS